MRKIFLFSVIVLFSLQVTAQQNKGGINYMLGFDFPVGDIYKRAGVGGALSIGYSYQTSEKTAVCLSTGLDAIVSKDDAASFVGFYLDPGFGYAINNKWDCFVGAGPAYAIRGNNRFDFGYNVGVGIGRKIFIGESFIPLSLSFSVYGIQQEYYPMATLGVTLGAMKF